GPPASFVFIDRSPRHGLGVLSPQNGIRTPHPPELARVGGRSPPTPFPCGGRGVGADARKGSSASSPGASLLGRRQRPRPAALPPSPGPSSDPARRRPPMLLHGCGVGAAVGEAAAVRRGRRCRASR